jgi:predicted flap endonuclease-1-like 5' DNA nuclease
MANVSAPVDVQPESRPESSTGVRVSLRARSNPDAPTEEIVVLSDYLVDEPTAQPRSLALPELPPLPGSANPTAVRESELDRVTRLYHQQRAYVTELETVLSRRSQELLEADEREAVLVRRFHLQTLRIAELERQAREQNTLIEQLQASLPKRPAEASELLSIRGIGPKYARTLSALGVTTVAELAALTEDDVNRVEHQLRIRNGRIRRERWVEQAQQLAPPTPSQAANETAPAATTTSTEA